MEIDLEVAAKEHSDWKSRLQTAINQKQTLDVRAIASDQGCSLGKWLAGDGKKYFLLGTFSECVRKHREFHRVLADVAQAIKEKKFGVAETMIGPGTAYSFAATDVAEAIRNLDKDVKKKTVGSF